MGSNPDPCYIQNCVIMNRVIKRFRCSRRISVHRSINQMGSQICVSVEFDSEGVEIGRQGISVEYYLCETYL